MNDNWSLKMDSSSSIWSEFPSAEETYSEYLKYAGTEVHAGLSHNSKITGNSEVVVAHASKYYPLKCYLGDHGKCAMLHLRNLHGTALFKFTDEAYYGCVTIQAPPEHASVLNHAFRTIVPKCFEQVSQLAGPMGLQEVLIDGSNSGDDYGKLTFYVNPDTPLRVNITNSDELIILVDGDTRHGEKFVWDKKESNLDFIKNIFSSDSSEESSDSSESSNESEDKLENNSEWNEQRLAWPDLEEEERNAGINEEDWVEVPDSLKNLKMKDTSNSDNIKLILDTIGEESAEMTMKTIERIEQIEYQHDTVDEPKIEIKEIIENAELMESVQETHNKKKSMDFYKFLVSTIDEKSKEEARMIVTATAARLQVESGVPSPEEANK